VPHDRREERVQYDDAMRLALACSRTVLGTTSPNPPVGAVILDRDGELAGQGATQPAGGDHAEIVALREAGERARGGTAVVTLEPCRHIGRTPPCTDALLRAGVARVVIACADPTAQAGGGAQVLRDSDAGIEVLTGVLADEVSAGPLEPWLGAQRLGRPYVTWKYAATLDGRAAAADGSSRWITGEAARADVHRLRGEVDAVVVGVGTVLADDPQLTTRPDPGHQPLRVVLEGARTTPDGARVTDDGAPSLRLPGRPAPAAVLSELADRGVVSVLLEGGPAVAGAFLKAGLVDRVVGYVAPALLGAGPAVLADAGVGTISAAVRLRLDDVTRVGDDVRLVLRRA
jgi:diaminohydroxyphosphoribosylaminopyrimidine deaminase / 5-amino-6-(5-phosphoribosylamino)uracil reductase